MGTNIAESDYLIISDTFLLVDLLAILQFCTGIII